MTTPVLWREDDPEVFRGTILAAAGRLGVQPLAVEKDYWVCEALWAITTKHPGEVVFKGGTSLEKLGIIRRFSEDLDLLVVGHYPSKNAEQRTADPARFHRGGNRFGTDRGDRRRQLRLVPPLRLSQSTAGASR